MSEQQAIDAALDALEIENEVDEPVIEEVIEVEEEQEQEEEEEQDNPPGYIDNVDDWVAAGKDPALFKNKKMYSREYERIKELKEIKETLSTVVSGVGEWKEQQTRAMAQQIEQARANAIEELEQAREDVDVDAAIKAQKKIDELDKPKQETYQPNPVLVNFFKSNPILDDKSTQFDREIYDDVAQRQEVILDKLTGGDRYKVLSESQIERSMKLALRDSKEFYSDKFVSPRISRKSAPVKSRVKVQESTDWGVMMKSMKITGLNKRDTEAAYEVYEMIKNQPGDKEKNKIAADKFAQQLKGAR